MMLKVGFVRSYVDHYVTELWLKEYFLRVLSELNVKEISNKNFVFNIS